MSRKRSVEFKCPYCEIVCATEITNPNGESVVLQCYDPACRGSFVVEVELEAQVNVHAVPGLAPKQGAFAVAR